MLSINVGEQMTMPKTWVRRVRPALDELGPATVWRRVEQWWPTPPTESLEGSEAQLLKHLIWALELTAHPSGEQLVARLAGITWRPQPHPMAVLKPAAAFLANPASTEGELARRTLLAAIDRTAP